MATRTTRCLPPSPKQHLPQRYITPSFITLANSAHMKAWSLGTNAYAVNRVSGAFSVQNSNLERYQIGLLIEAVSNSTGGGTIVRGIIGG